MRLRTVSKHAIICATAGLCVLASGLSRPAGSAPQPPVEAERIGENLYRVGAVRVDTRAKTAVCSGKINMRRGLVEYLAVAPQGKMHESVVTLDVRPLHLQIALILLDLEPKGGLRYQGDTQVPQGSPVNVWVSWQREGRTVKVHAEDLLWDMEKKRPMERQAWVFSGSAVDQDGFVADRELSLIASFRDPAAIINNAHPSGSDDTVYKVNERIVPPLGTPITLTVTPR